MALDSTLLQKLGPEKRVLIWAHAAPLDEQTPGLRSLDYLLDGLLAGHLRSQSAPLQHVVLSHPSFGESFWVAFVNVNEVSPKTFMKMFCDVIPEKARGEVLVYTGLELPQEWGQAIRQSFKSVETLVIH